MTLAQDVDIHFTMHHTDRSRQEGQMNIAEYLTEVGREQDAQEIERRKAANGGEPTPCVHIWGIDGAHSNEYCKRCFISKESNR